jgi:hypothetical protein
MNLLSNILKKVKLETSNEKIAKLVVLNLIFNALFVRIVYPFVLMYSMRKLIEEQINVGEFILYTYTIYAYYLLSTMIFFSLLKLKIKDKLLLSFLNIILIRQTHLNIIIADAIKWEIGNWYLTTLAIVSFLSMIFILRFSFFKQSSENNEIILDEDFNSNESDEARKSFPKFSKKLNNIFNYDE